MADVQNSPLQVQAGTLAELRRFAAGGYLYALLDDCDAPAVTAKIQELGSERAVCLFISQKDKQYWQWPPYLIVVDEPTLDWIAHVLGDSPWGTLLFSKSGLEPLRTHLRRFLIPQLVDGQRRFFRFYDPRLLKPHLQNSRPADLELFFGPVRGFGVIESGAQAVSLFHAETRRRSITQSPQLFDSKSWFSRGKTVSPSSSSPEFEEDMARFVKNAFPARCQALGDAAVLEMIRYGSQRAARYHFTRENARNQFIELLFLLGRNFDQNPALSWVQAILHDSSITDPAVRMERLWQTAADMIAQNTFAGGQ